MHYMTWPVDLILKCHAGPFEAQNGRLSKNTSERSFFRSVLTGVQN